MRSFVCKTLVSVGVLFAVGCSVDDPVVDQRRTDDDGDTVVIECKDACEKTRISCEGDCDDDSCKATCVADRDDCAVECDSD